MHAPHRRTRTPATLALAACLALGACGGHPPSRDGAAAQAAPVTSSGATAPAGAAPAGAAPASGGPATTAAPASGTVAGPAPSPTPAARAASGPQVLSVQPPQGPRGTAVAIAGSGFSAVAADNVVRFDGQRVRVTAAMTTRLDVVVHDRAAPGLVTVTVAGARSNGLPFVVTNPLPVVCSVDPPFSTAATTRVTLRGHGLAPPPPDVTIGGNLVALLSSAPGEVACGLPSYFTGTVQQGGSVRLTTAHGPSNGFGYTHRGGLSVSGVVPSSGPVGTRVTLLAAGLATAGGLTVDFTDEQNNAVAAGVLSAAPGAPGAAVVEVPAGAVTGRVELHDASDWANPAVFRVGGPAAVVSPVRARGEATPWTPAPQRTQLLYTAGEVGRAGRITGFAWQHDSDAPGNGRTEAATFRGCVVRLGHTTRTELSRDLDANFDRGAPAVAFQGDYAVPADRWGFIDLPLSTAFAYDGASNLIVEVAHQGGTAHAQDLWQVGDVPDLRRVVASSATASTGTPDRVLHGARFTFARADFTANTPRDRSFVTVAAGGELGLDVLRDGPARTVLAFSPDELGHREGGRVLALRLRAPLGTRAGTYQDLVVRMTHTSAWSLDEDFVTAAVPSEVARYSTFTVPAGQGWIELPLATPFTFVAGAVLSVEVSCAGGSATQALACGPAAGGRYRSLAWPSVTAAEGERSRRSYAIQVVYE